MIPNPHPAPSIRQRAILICAIAAPTFPLSTLHAAAASPNFDFPFKGGTLEEFTAASMR